MEYLQIASLGTWYTSHQHNRPFEARETFALGRAPVGEVDVCVGLGSGGGSELSLFEFFLRDSSSAWWSLHWSASVTDDGHDHWRAIVGAGSDGYTCIP